MASTNESVVKKLSKDPNYQKLFKEIYPQGITIDTISDAIAEFEKTLLTPNARFDKYLRGNLSILTNEEKEGLKVR